MYPIRKDIPVPPVGGGRPVVYPLADMAVGDSFFVPLSGGKTVGGLQGVLTRAAKRFPDKKFTARRLTEDGVEGVGCWRTA